MTGALLSNHKIASDKDTRHMARCISKLVCVVCLAAVVSLHAQSSPAPTLEARISDALWSRKSAEWETELATVTAELSALERPAMSFIATGERILELVKRAGILYKTQDPAERRRVLDSVLSNCTFDGGSVCPTYKKPFDLFARASETGEWRRVWDDFRNWLTSGGEKAPLDDKTHAAMLLPAKPPVAPRQSG